MKAKLELENELRDVVSRLISQVSLASKQTRTDINLASEDAWIPILREVFQASKLENLNRHKKTRNSEIFPVFEFVFSRLFS